MRAPVLRPAPLRWIAGLLVLALLGTAGTPAVRRSAGGTVPPGGPRAALMPVENLAGREEQSQLFTRIFFAQLVASEALEMVEPAQVEAAMDSLGIRASGSMTMGEVRAMADTLHAPYLVLGSVLESGTVQGATGPVPSVGATLRLVEAASGRVPWAGVPPYHPHTITVPGACAGWCDLLERFGRLALSAVLAPAIRLAEEGFPVAPLTAYFWGWSTERLLSAPGGSELLLEGNAPQAGQVFRNPGLARTLRGWRKGVKPSIIRVRLASLSPVWCSLLAVA